MPDVPPTGASLDRAMRAHFRDALLIHDAMIAGKPERAVAAAKALAIVDDPDALPAGWRPFVEQMQQQARRITATASPAQAAAAASELVVTCGRCHQKLGGPRVTEEPAPLEAASVDAQMKRHLWASQRLWEGLVVPSDESWATGVKALATAEFPEDVLSISGGEARSSARELARLLDKAPATMELEQRSALYAKLLLTCGTCHRAIRIARND